MPAPKSLDTTLANTLTGIAKKQLEEGLSHRLPRLQSVQKFEAAYMNKTPRTLKRRMNVPLPVMSGFIDTLVAKIDDPPSITINPTELADLPKARKSTALMRVDSSPTRGMWDIKDILGKKMAAFSGRAVYQTYAESDPRYKHHLELVDTFDFVCEPGGGWHLETHFFLGKVNVFRTKAELQEGVENGWYDGNQVSKLINAQTMMKAEERTEMELRRQRLQNLGLNLDAHSYTGQDIYNFTEWPGFSDPSLRPMFMRPSRLLPMKALSTQELRSPQSASNASD